VLEVNERLSIPDAELEVLSSRSSGPGGQNVNKVETRVTVRFDVAGSAVLTEDERRLILERLASRITKEGVLQVSSQVHRSQGANRDEAMERLGRLLAAALRPRRRRKRTRVPRSAKRKRLEGKRKRGEVKRLRRPPKEG